MRTAGLGASLAFLLVVGTAHAQGVAADYSADDFVKAILTGPQPCPKGMSQAACEANPKTRRFTLARPAAPRAAAPAGRAASRLQAANTPRLMSAVATPRKITSADVLVTFASGSAEITPQGQANLRSIAAGLNRASLAPISFEIAGYTDVTGSAAFNQDLSLRRAKAVRAFLIASAVDPARLTTVGFGPDHLMDPEDPTSELNRRVELHRAN